MTPETRREELKQQIAELNKDLEGLNLANNAIATAKYIGKDSALVVKTLQYLFDRYHAVLAERDEAQAQLVKFEPPAPPEAK